MKICIVWWLNLPINTHDVDAERIRVDYYINRKFQFLGQQFDKHSRGNIRVSFPRDQDTIQRRGTIVF